MFDSARGTNAAFAGAVNKLESLETSIEDSFATLSASKSKS
jgi:hypothetical protein